MPATRGDQGATAENDRARTRGQEEAPHPVLRRRPGDLLDRLFGACLLDFDRRATHAYAEVTRKTTAAGVPRPAIAAICR
jgi:hypothetical protein